MDFDDAEDSPLVRLANAVLLNMLRYSVELTRYSIDVGVVQKRLRDGSWHNEMEIPDHVRGALMARFLRMGVLEAPTGDPVGGQLRLMLGKGRSAFFLMYARPCSDTWWLVIHHISDALAAKSITAEAHPELLSEQARLAGSGDIAGLEALRRVAMDRGDGFTELWAWSEMVRGLKDASARIDAAEAMEAAAARVPGAGWFAVDAIGNRAEALTLVGRGGEAVAEAERAVARAREISLFVPWTAEIHLVAAKILERAGLFDHGRTYRESAAALMRDLAPDDLWAAQILAP
ncbi:MAG: hypothetical protein AAGE52_40690 [Myxococcota bacterium]